MSRKNRKRRKRLMRQMQMEYSRIERLRRLYGYDPVRHLDVQRRFYAQTRVLYFGCWIHNWLSALSCFDVEYVGVGRVNVGRQIAKGLFGG